jgi:uncharacterized protein (DUF2141 family)
MKKILSAFALFLTISNYLYAQFTLKIDISDFRNNTGKVMLQVFDDKEKVIAREMGDIKDRSCRFTIKDLKGGRYAVRYFHDENLNQELETNMFGKPTEGYGFSNNVTGSFGPPPFEKWLFTLDGDKTILLKPEY